MAVARVLFGDDVIEADCLAGDIAGDCVYVTADKISGRFQVSKIDPRVLTAIPSVGIIQSKPTSTTCLVRLSGVLSGVYTGLTPGAQQFVALNGQLTESIASITPLPNQRVMVQQIGVALASDTIAVLPQAPNIHR